MRKQPAQQRSRQMVDALLEAAGQVIVQHGLTQATTRQIAERAGVSVGSLYQYFHDKDAIIAALMDRLIADLNQRIAQELLTLLDADTRTVARRLLHAALHLFEGRDGLHLELIRHWHRLDIERAVQAFERHMQEVFRLYALRHYRELHIQHLPVRAFVLTHSTVFTLLRYLSLDTPPFTREQLVEELVDMIAGFRNDSKTNC